MLRFLTDGMLGKLTRWLRMLGYDVKYYNDLEDEHLIKIAAEEKRILLTKDMDLFRRSSTMGIQSFLVEGRTEAEKLAELAKRFKIRLEIDVNDSRCPKCNTGIVHASKEAIVDRIPKSTSRFYKDFWICPNCGQIYWQGSHWKKIGHVLSQARQLVESSQSRTDKP